MYMNNKNNAVNLLRQTIEKIDGAYSPATIRAYRVDFGEFIRFSNGINEAALPAQPHSVVNFIIKLTNSGRSSASIRRAIAGIASVHKLNRFTDPTKDPDVMLEMRRMHRKLGRASHQAQGVTAEILEKMLNATESNIKGIRDRALLLVAYDTLCRRSELIALRVEDVRTKVINGVENTSILLRKSKTDQDAIGRWLHLSKRTQLALNEWLKQLNAETGPLFRGINSGQHIMQTLGAGQINRIYKKIARVSEIDSVLAGKISGHSMRVGHAQDLVSSGASLPIIMSMGRWSKSDTVMRYVEQISFTI
jgi:site-specific recombinase XerD